jgi:hypothetical protein
VNWNELENSMFTIGLVNMLDRYGYMQVGSVWLENH